MNPYREMPVDPVEEETVVGNDWPRILGYMGFLCTHVLGGAQPSVVMYSVKEWFLRWVPPGGTRWWTTAIHLCWL